jgi:hypothetical protein
MRRLVPKKAEGNYRGDTFERLRTAGDSGMAPFTARPAAITS